MVRDLSAGRGPGLFFVSKKVGLYEKTVVFVKNSQSPTDFGITDVQGAENPLMGELLGVETEIL
jgi:hypothetical protein